MKIGLFGGAFNPLHNGHMSVAHAAIESENLDKLIFIPSGNAPHKKEGDITRFDRFEMIKRAIENEDKMLISDFELNREEVSYSADTVEHFKKLYPKDELYFIIGDDSYKDLPKWYQPERIIKVCTLLVFPREGVKVLPPAKFIYMDKVEASSSDIREQIKNGKDCRKLLPKEVFDYIIKGNLYKR